MPNFSTFGNNIFFDSHFFYLFEQKRKKNRKFEEEFLFLRVKYNKYVILAIEMLRIN